MNRRGLVTLLACTACLSAGTARADVPVLGSPQSVGAAGGPPVLSMGPFGDARIAWATPTGVWAALRSGPAVPFGPAQRVAAAGAFQVALAHNPTGAAALVFTSASDGSDARIALAAPGAPFGAAEPVPVAERAPVAPGHENVIAESRFLSGFAAGLALDGSVAVVYRDADHRAGLTRAIAVVRDPLGRWGQPQVLGTDIVNLSVAASGTRLTAMWTERDPGAPADAPRRVWVADAGADGRFGAALALSPAGQDADNNFGGLGFVTSYRGDLLVHYNRGEPGHPIPNGVSVVERPAGGVWGPDAPIAAGMRPTAAVGDRGDAVVVWSVGAGLGLSHRPPGGRWGRAELAELPPGNVETAPVAIDALGTVIALRRLDGRLVAVLRRPEGGIGEPVDVVEPGTVANWPAVAIDPYGNGVIAWTTADGGGPREVFVRPYSARAPVVGRPQVSPYDLVFSLSEPARIDVTITRLPGRRRARSAARRGVVGFRAAGHARRNRVALPARARRMLARRGRFRLVARARDGGPRVGRRAVTVSR